MDYKLFYETTYKYLLQKAKNHNVDENALNEYFVPETGNGDFFATYAQKDLNNLLFRFAFHAQNGGQISKTIKFPTRDTPEDQHRMTLFQEVFCDFNPQRLLKKYGDANALFENFIEALGFNKTSSLSKTGDFKKSMPYKYCKSVFSAAVLLNQYDSYQAFIDKLRSYDDMAPIYIMFEVYGLSIALACDFIKELPEQDFDLPKPDSHIVNILFELKLLETKGNDIANYLAIKEFKKMVNEIQKTDKTVTSYKLDKILWLICTETFYNHDNRRNSGDIKRKEYIKHIKSVLSM